MNPASAKLFLRAQTAQQKGDISFAIKAYRKLIKQLPGHPDISFLLGAALQQKGQNDECEKLFKTALKAKPKNPQVMKGLASFYFRKNEYAEAIKWFESVDKLALGRDFEIRASIAACHIKLKQFGRAKEILFEVLQRAPNNYVALNNMALACFGLCEIDSSVDFYSRAFERLPKRTDVLCNKLMTMNYLPDVSPRELFLAHVDLGKKLPSSDYEFKRGPKNLKIRLGFISADFRTHSVAYFLLGLFSNLDRSEIELICYYNNQFEDELTAKFQSLSDSWRPIGKMDDQAVVDRIRSDQLDVLIDLSGLTGQHRVGVLSRRVASIQINWLGYPHSTGIETMDYRIVDDITDPEPLANQLCSEKLIRLPKGFLCYGGNESADYQSIPPCATAGCFTFGSFNNLAKVNDRVLNAWIQILKRAPKTHLILKAKQLDEPEVRNKLAQSFLSAGISEDRFELFGRISDPQEHLDLYNRVDVALDTFPYNGTTTTCEAMWMGVPTLCFRGDRHAARVSASILFHAGFEEFVCEDLGEYIDRAVELAQDPESLLILRPLIRERMKQSSICDARSFAEIFVQEIGRIVHAHEVRQT